MRRPWLVHSFSLILSMMMLLWQGPVVHHSTRWRGQRPVVDRSPLVMMMMMRGRRPDIRSHPKHVLIPEGPRNQQLGLRAGPSRRWRRSGPLPTLMRPGRVTSPGRLVMSRRSTMVISVTALITVWMVAIWSLSPGWAVGPWGSIYHRHTGWDSLTGLLIMGSETERPVIRSLGRLGQGGCLVFLCRVLLLPGRPIISFSRVGPAVHPLARATQWSHPSSRALFSRPLPPSSSASELCPMQPTPQVTNLYRHRMEIPWYTA